MLVKQALALNIIDHYKPAGALGTDPTLSTLASPIIYNILIISGIVALITILVAGFSYISASGDKGKITQASQALTYGIIGLVVVVAAYLITNLMGSILGFKFL